MGHDAALERQTHADPAGAYSAIFQRISEKIWSKVGEKGFPLFPKDEQ